MDRKKILIVDDEAEVTGLVKTHLEQTGGFVVRTENESRKAVAAAVEFRPDLVILDYLMPDMDGGEVAAQLKEVDSLRETPIIFLTGIVSRDDVGVSGRLVRDQIVVAKPVNLETLERLIRNRLQAG